MQLATSEHLARYPIMLAFRDLGIEYGQDENLRKIRRTILNLTLSRFD